MVIRRHILGRIIGGTADAEAAATPSPPDICAQTCPSRAILELIADKWALLVLHALQPGPMRNGELMRAIGGVSQKMLTQTLRELERNGLVERLDHHEVPPRVDYRLSALGVSLSAKVRDLGAWAEAHIAEVEAARRDFEMRERGQRGGGGA
ncbi:MAG: helix-turn-helix transcriptional regulator [Hyphomicrobiaceae bacterium]|nr:helix-turn-helix transcriptional regulator [Hyphomicrobiaceae bacterium]